jgi:hypothetical protein
MDHKIVVCDDGRCIIKAPDSVEKALEDSVLKDFDRVIEDIVRVYPDAILTGAVAASKYIRHPIIPRVTRDVDIILNEDDFEAFCEDEIPEMKCSILDNLFEDPGSSSHSLKHKETGIYVDFLSAQSKPIRKKIVKYILNNREKTTNQFHSGDHMMDILKPELIIAMKMNRYTKRPDSERGQSDRKDIINVLKSAHDGKIPIDQEIVKGFLNSREIKKYTAILDDVTREMDKTVDDDFLICDADDRCVLMAEDFSDDMEKDTASDRFNKVIADVAKVYPDAILVGAVAAAKYIRHPNEPRKTQDVDVILNERDFAEFLLDDIPEETLKKLESYFENSDSSSHSMKHKETGIYIDFLSSESQPIRKKIVNHILDHRDKTTHLLRSETDPIQILRPEYLLAMKVNRYCKDPKTERGISDKLDILKILKTLKEKSISVDHETVRGFLNSREIKNYDTILEDTMSDKTGT